MGSLAFSTAAVIAPLSLNIAQAGLAPSLLYGAGAAQGIRWRRAACWQPLTLIKPLPCQSSQTARTANEHPFLRPAR